MTSKLRRPSLFGYDSGLGPVVDRFYPTRPCVMEVGIPAGYVPTAGKRADAMLENKAAKSPKAVNFEDGDSRMDGRKKYLTAKYGAHQMALIRKRLGVEMWLLDEMSKLYDAQTGDQTELDLDELLDIDGASRRRAYLQRLLGDTSAAPRTQVDAFIEELLVQADTL